MTIIYFKKSIINYNFLVKYSKKSIFSIPEIKNITLNINFFQKKKKYLILIILLIIELVSKQKPFFIPFKKSVISLNIKKGDIYNCKVNIENKKLIYNFLFSVFYVFTKYDNFKSLRVINNGINFSIINVNYFFELENEINKFLFNMKLNITFNTNTNELKKNIFFFNSLNLPIK